MATDAHGTLLRVSAANTRGSRPARAPLKVILVCELAAAMKQPNELVKPTMPMNQENQGVKCRDRSRNGVTSPPSTLIPATGPFQSANPATAAQLDSTYKMVITRIAGRASGCVERRAEVPVREHQDNQGENEQAQCFAAEHDERGPRRDHDAAQQDRHDWQYRHIAMPVLAISPVRLRRCRRAGRRPIVRPLRGTATLGG